MVCSGCAVEQPVEEFYLRSPGGSRRKDCKTCVKGRVSRHRQDNPETHKARDKARYRTPHRQAYYRSPAMLAYRKAYNATYFAENGAAVRERQGKQVRALYAAARRGRKKAGAFVVTAGDITRLISRHNGLCAYCDQPWEHLDHVVPLARGGRHSIGNLVPACASCNQTKSKSTVTEWRVRMIKVGEA